MQIHHLYLGFTHDIRRRGGCTWSVAVQAGWKAHPFAVEFHMLHERRWRRPGINPEANERGGGMSMPSLKDRDPSGQVWQMSAVGTQIKRE